MSDPFLYDSFSSATQVNATAHTGETGHSWVLLPLCTNWLIGGSPNGFGPASNEFAAMNNFPGDGTGLTTQNGIISTTQSPSSEITVETPCGISFGGVFELVISPTQELGGIRFRVTQGADWGTDTLYELIFPTPADNISFVDPLNGSSFHRIRLEVAATRVRAFVDGALLLTKTGSFNVLGYYVGLYYSGPSSASVAGASFADYIRAHELVAVANPTEQVSHYDDFNTPTDQPLYNRALSGAGGVWKDGPFGGTDLVFKIRGDGSASQFGTGEGRSNDYMPNQPLTASAAHYFVEATIDTTIADAYGLAFSLYLGGSTLPENWTVNFQGNDKHDVFVLVYEWNISDNILAASTVGNFDIGGTVSTGLTGIAGGPYLMGEYPYHYPLGPHTLRLEAHNYVLDVYLDGVLQQTVALPSMSRMWLPSVGAERYYPFVPGHVGFRTSRSNSDSTGALAYVTIDEFRAGVFVSGNAPPPTAFWTSLHAAKETL